MISIKCVGCEDELDCSGALVFSPPGYSMGDCEKFHICVDCWPVVREIIVTGSYL